MGFFDWLFGKKNTPRGKAPSSGKSPAPARLAGVTQRSSSKLPAKAAPQLSSNERARDVLKQWMNEKEE